MSKVKWAQSNYAIGLDFITQNEEQAKASTLLDAGCEVTGPTHRPTAIPFGTL